MVVVVFWGIRGGLTVESGTQAAILLRVETEGIQGGVHSDASTSTLAYVVTMETARAHAC